MSEPESPAPNLSGEPRSSFAGELKGLSAPPGYLAKVPANSPYGNCELHYPDSKYSEYAFVLATRKSAMALSILAAILIFLSPFFTWIQYENPLPFSDNSDNDYDGFRTGIFGVLPFVLSLCLLPISIAALQGLGLSAFKRVRALLLPALKFVYLGSGVFSLMILFVFLIAKDSVHIILSLLIENTPIVGTVVDFLVGEINIGAGFYLAFVGTSLLIIAGLLNRKKIYFSMEHLRA